MTRARQMADTILDAWPSDEPWSDPLAFALLLRSGFRWNEIEPLIDEVGCIYKLARWGIREVAI